MGGSDLTTRLRTAWRELLHAQVEYAAALKEALPDGRVVEFFEGTSKREAVVVRVMVSSAESMVAVKLDSGVVHMLGPEYIKLKE